MGYVDGRSTELSRMLKKPAGSVLASLRGSPYRTEYASPHHLLRPGLGQGASLRSRVGRVGSLAFLSILRRCSPLVPVVQAIEVLLCRNGFPTARYC